MAEIAVRAVGGFAARGSETEAGKRDVMARRAAESKGRARIGGGASRLTAAVWKAENPSETIGW